MPAAVTVVKLIDVKFDGNLITTWPSIGTEFEVVNLILAEPSVPAVYFCNWHTGFALNIPGVMITPGVWSSLLNIGLASSIGVSPSLSMVVRANETVAPS